MFRFIQVRNCPLLQPQGKLSAEKAPTSRSTDTIQVHHVQNETGAGSAAPDNCFEFRLSSNQKEHRPRELPTMHKSPHPSIQAQENHGKNPGYDVRQAVSLRKMRFAILPLVIHRESQFVSAGDDVLIRGGSSWISSQ
jgi:hypothetical protein